MSALIAGGITAGAALVIAFLGLISSIHYRLGKLDNSYGLLPAENEKIRELISSEVRQLRSENEQTREQMRLQEERTREEMRLQEERTRELIRSESEATRAEIRRLADALVSHHHEADGSIVFRIPPPQEVGD